VKNSGQREWASQQTAQHSWKLRDSRRLFILSNMTTSVLIFGKMVMEFLFHHFQEVDMALASRGEEY